MWAEMDAALAEVRAPKREENSFTSHEFFARFNFPNTSGHRQLQKLMAKGLVERRGIGNKVYYIWKKS